MSRSRRNDSPVHRGHVQSDDEIKRQQSIVAVLMSTAANTARSGTERNLFAG